ncbi:MAG TPA: hypothetical protein PKC21_10080 [Oligoflexia bacterium]|nr:hypothetical protein [Oligoflexia bacterium]HMR25688.1 hypothetical protein [Oligoflexia bacterium]
MRFYLLLLLAFASTGFAQSRGRCGEIINNQNLSAEQQSSTYDANDFIDQNAVTKFVRGEHVIIHYKDQNYSTQNYVFTRYRVADNKQNNDDILFVRMIRGEEIVVCQGSECYKGVPRDAYQQNNPSDDPTQTIRTWEEPCRGVDDSRECRPSGRGH